MSSLRAFHEHFLQVFYIVEIHFFLFLPDFTIFLHRKGLKPPLRRKEKKSEISIDRKESKLHANFSYRSNSLSPSGNKNLILARLGLELFFLSFKFLQRIGIFSPLIEGDGINSNRVVSRAPLPLLPSLLYSP